VSKALAIALWGAIFLIGLIVLMVRLIYAPEVRAVAAKQMHTNHQLLADDVKNGSHMINFIGHYVRSNVIAGQLLSKDDLSPTPLLEALQKPSFAVLTQQDLVANGSIDVGTVGKICNKDEPVIEAQVEALLCAIPKDTRPCMALVSVGSDIGQKLRPNESVLLPDCPKSKK
jgi:hypothetical protein